MVKISVFLCVLAVWGAFAGVNCATPRNAPAPTAVDCTTVIVSMADCLGYVTKGGEDAKPKPGCCSGLKTVLKTAPQCICESFKNAGQLGVVLDMKKAMSLPSACGVSAPPLSNCGLPGLAPAHSPKASAPSPTSGGPTTSPVSPAASPDASDTRTSQNVEAPAPAPSQSGQSATVSVAALFVGLAVAASGYLF